MNNAMEKVSIYESFCDRGKSRDVIIYEDLFLQHLNIISLNMNLSPLASVTFVQSLIYAFKIPLTLLKIPSNSKDD